MGRGLRGVVFGTAIAGVLLVAPAGPDPATPPASAGSGGEGLEGRSVEAPIVQARPIPQTRAATSRPAALPSGATAVFPGFNGDSIFVTLPPREASSLSSAQVLDQVVRPIARAAGLPRRGAGTFRASRRQGKGDRRPGASLAALARDTCREFAEMQRSGFDAMCAVMTGRERATPEIDQMFDNGEGMTFAQFKADIERSQIQYAFPQLVGSTPIEHVGLLASRWEGETITTVHGSLFTRFAIANSRRLSFARAAKLGARRVSRLRGVRRASVPRKARGELVLLPYGGARHGRRRVPALRYAWRTLVEGVLDDKAEALWTAYFDARSGAVLELMPLGGDEFATGETWRRDPTTPTEVAGFTVDPPSGGQFTLEADDGTTRGVRRVDRLGDGDFDDGEVTVAGTAGGVANFNVAPINDDANAICGAGGNNTFRQVNAFGHVARMRDMVINAGTVPPFPEGAMTIWTDDPDPDGGGNSLAYASSGNTTLKLVQGSAFSASTCPDTGGASLPGPTDVTTMGHEFWHAGMARLHDRRPADWCGSASCTMPSGRALFHDFADAFGHAYASINCQAGYSRKNNPTANASLRCVANTSETSGVPRLSDVAVPFMPAAPNDHFPEKRPLYSASDPGIRGYADGQIAAAALWQVRRGMRSKCLPSGTPQYFVRLMRALWNFGFITSAGTGDEQIYRYLQDLLRQMVVQWATSGSPGGPPAFFHNGNHTTNKVTSGFARAGVFLVPHQCIDGSSATTEATSCPASQGGENGGDAIVDIDDNDTGDDPTIDSVVHREIDWLRRAGGPPTFQVWTGPRFKFIGASASSFTPSTASPSPCYVQYQVELSPNQDFSGTVVTSTPSSGVWRTVSTTTEPVCFGTWTPTTAEWDSLKGTSGDVRIHYRVRTRNAAGDAASERISTAPGNGLWNVPPAYAVVRDSGQP
ncbi:MAG TPA: hypothetical protein VF529_16455 [Solirubrobacteraceae bacterium]|jgi:hypothetical protein